MLIFSNQFHTKNEMYIYKNLNYPKITMKLLLPAILLLWGNLFLAQDMKVNFSDKMTLKLNKDGYINTFIGETEKNIYVEFQSKNKKQEVVINRIGVFDKSSMKEVNSLVIADKNNKIRVNELGDKLKAQIKFIDEKIFIFYTEESKTELKIFAESYSLNLDKVVKMKKVMTIPKDSKRENVFPTITNNKSKLVLSRLESETNKIQFIYTVFDLELEELVKSEIDMPLPAGIQNEDVFAIENYMLDNNDNFYFNETYSIKAGEKRAGLFYKTVEYKYEFFVSILSIESGDIEMIDMNDKNTSLFNVKVVEIDNKVKILGFFSDFKKDPLGIRTHGFCYRELNPKTFEVSEMVYTYFDQALLDELFKTDEEDKLKTNSKKKNAAAEAEKDKDALSNLFVIEQIKVDDKGNMIVFCSKMDNYSYQVCTTDANGRTTCRTVYECAKSNVTVFKLSSEGDIIWSSNIDRKAVFGGWNIYDLRVIEDENNYYVSYSSRFKADAEEKTKKTKKNSAEYIDQMEYGVFDKETGENEKKNVRINEEETKKSEKKRCSATDIRVFNDEFYLISRKRHIAPWIFATCLCPPVFLGIGMFTQAGQVEDAYIGKIELVR
jgi:hypothetical protein